MAPTRHLTDFTHTMIPHQPRYKSLIESPLKIATRLLLQSTLAHGVTPMVTKINNITIPTLLLCSILGCHAESILPNKSSGPNKSSSAEQIANVSSPSLPSTHASHGSAISVTPNATSEEPNQDKPVIFVATLNATSANPGDRVTLEIQGHVLTGWHIYAAEQASGASIATRFELSLPNGVSSVGEWKHPKPIVGFSIFGPISKYTDKFESSIDLLLAESLAAGTLDLEISIVFQACNFELCLPPQTIHQTLSLNVTKENKK